MSSYHANIGSEICGHRVERRHLYIWMIAQVTRTDPPIWRLSPFVAFGRLRDPGSDEKEAVGMEPKNKSPWVLLNPLMWIVALVEPFLRFLGLMPHPRADGFENLQKTDIDEAAEDARRTEEAVDAIIRDMSPAEVVRAYGRANAEARATMDLSALDLEGQDWLLSLSDEELDLLGMSTTAACARSLEAMVVKPAYRKPAAETEAPEILSIPSAENDDDWKRRYVADRFRQVQRELWLSLGVPNPKPQHAAVTLH
jgi:hypothetical protein